MRFAYLVLLMFLAGCVQQCPACECPPCECPQLEEVNETEECVTANITITTVQVNQTCNQTINETNITGPELPEQEMEGILFANGSYLLILDDVSYPTASLEPCGIFSIAHAGNLSIAERLIICPGDSKSWVSPEGRIYRILVKKVAAGYTKESIWADVMIFG